MGRYGVVMAPCYKAPLCEGLEVHAGQYQVWESTAAPFSCVAALLMWAVRSLLQGGCRNCRVQILRKPCIKGGGISSSECAVLLKARGIYTVALDMSE